ncbi:MAG: sugar transferase [Actinobacteria bacterium]|nr:sugar transferase [Actinomycetota bacterium]
MSSRKHQQTIKEVLDRILSLIALIILAIPMGIIAVLIRLESPGPALFKQERAGRDGKIFILYKFRSMKGNGGQNYTFHDEEHITTVGRLLRKWRLDELPQLINVLKGDMSLVGPRPALPYQVERYDSEQKRRLCVKPGVTGWSQIHGDEAISWPDRIKLDVWYVDHWSLWLDIKIILMTPGALLRIRKINVEKGPPPDEISCL